MSMRWSTFGLGLPGAKFACLADYANSRGAADMGLLPDMLPGYASGHAARALRRGVSRFPQTPGMDMIEMFDAAARDELAALYVVGVESGEPLQHRSCSSEEHLRRRAGYVPDRDRAARGCRPARGESL